MHFHIIALLVLALLITPVAAFDSTTGTGPHNFLYSVTLLPKCYNCHTSDIDFSLLKKDADSSCASCHKAQIASDLAQKQVHSPYRKLHCTSCHGYHRSRLNTYKYLNPINQKMLLVSADFKFDRNVKSLNRSEYYYIAAEHCARCHPGKVNEMASSKMLHGPVLEGDCLFCHNPHSAAHPKLLKYSIDGAGTNNGLCQLCHKDILNDQEATSAFRNGKQSLHQLHISEQKLHCLDCHDVHASNQEKFISDRFLERPGQKDHFVELARKADIGGSCVTSCHGGRDPEPIYYRHQAVTAPHKVPQLPPSSSSDQ